MSEEKKEKPARIKKVQEENVKKEKSPLILYAILGIVIIFAITAAVIIFGFHVRELKIEGNKRVPNSEIVELIGYESSSDNSLLLWLKNRKVDTSANDMISGITVSLDSPQVITVHVQEQVLVAGIENGKESFCYFNDQGYLLSMVDEKDPAVPLMEGIRLTSALPGEVPEVSDETAFKDMLSICDLMSLYGIIPDKIERTESDQYTVTIAKVRVQLGRNKEMEEKLTELNDLLPQIKTKSGILHLESYESSRDSIIFTKD